MDFKPHIELGYKILPHYQGLGYATELAKFFINWGFMELGLKKIIACCYPQNQASANVMKKCQMKYGGKYLYDGKQECDIYCINKKEL
jgi:RimJ/RimL family protein N-acetyltransferase